MSSTPNICKSCLNFQGYCDCTFPQYVNYPQNTDNFALSRNNCYRNETGEWVVIKTEVMFRCIFRKINFCYRCETIGNICMCAVPVIRKTECRQLTNSHTGKIIIEINNDNLIKKFVIEQQ
jgi:hypothetical protein